MKLSAEQVGRISRLVLDKLKEKELISFKVSEDAVLKRVAELFLNDLKAEDELDREVEKIMSRHSNEIDKGRLDYRKMFMLIKNKLARERGIVL